jgi:hypothetical protein
MLLALPCVRILAPTTHPLSVISATFSPAADEGMTHRNIWLDAVVIAFTFIAFYWCLGAVSSELELLISPAVPIASLATIDGLANVYVSSFSILTDALSSGASAVLMVPIGVGLYAKYLKNFWVYLLFTLVVSCVFHAGDRYWQDFVVSVSSSVLAAPIAWVLVTKLARRNILAYILLLMASTTFGKLPEILQHAVSLFRTEALASCLLLLLPIAYVLFLFFGKKQPDINKDATTPV